MAGSALASAEFVIWKKGAESPWLIGSTWEGRVVPSTETQGNRVCEGDCKEDVNDLDPLAPTPEAG